MCENSHCLKPDGAHPEGEDAFFFRRNEFNSGTEVFEFCGIVDAKSGQLLQRLPDLVRAETVIFDFGNVKRINSMGIALLLRCFKRIREEKNAELQVKSLNQINAMLFKMTGVFQLARLFEERVV
jgi:anti-anti-sigma regulatory factor